jgi:cytochrome c oxidase subunit II
MAATEQEVQRSELRWAVAVSVFVLVVFGLTLFAAPALHRNPPSNFERIDPATLHLSGEFTEPNLGANCASS